jgi:hypothetical protein
MYQRVFAFDFDGTLAENGLIPPTLQAALTKLREANYVLFLVTGRRFDTHFVNALKDGFAGMVLENGAVLYHTASDEVYLPFAVTDPRLVHALTAAGVPLEHGRASVSTRAPHDETVWRVLSQLGRSAAVCYNKGILSILPAGASTGTGLQRLLELTGYSPRNLVAFGDGENDVALLQLAEIGVAVADAEPALKDNADIVMAQPGPAGVLAALETYWPGKSAHLIAPARWRARPIPLGEDENGQPVFLSGAELASGNLGVFGDSGSGKSWVTGLLTEGMHRAGYQVLVIDAEGDFRGLRTLPGIVSFDGDIATLPPPDMVINVLEKMAVSVVLDLCTYPPDQRPHYVAGLINGLRALRARRFRPHWIVLEEAQCFLPPFDTDVAAALTPLLVEGGWAFVSYRPDRLAASVLATLDQCLLTRLTESDAARTVRQWIDTRDELPADIPHGYALLCGQQLVRLQTSIRRVPHIRHLYKYLDSPLPPHKRFAFRDAQGYLNLEAAGLNEFLQCLESLPIDSLLYHQARGDFAAWADGSLGDTVLASGLSKVAKRGLVGEALRESLAQCVASHYAELLAQQ